MSRVVRAWVWGCVYSVACHCVEQVKMYIIHILRMQAHNARASVECVYDTILYGNRIDVCVVAHGLDSPMDIIIVSLNRIIMTVRT